MLIQLNWLEHLADTEEVSSSSLDINTIGVQFSWLECVLWEHEVLGSSPDTPTNKGCQFRWLERLICNQEVESSSLSRSTNTSVAQWLAQDAYTIKDVGSSPSRSTFCFLNSVGLECYFYKVEVVGSNPSESTFGFIAQLVERSPEEAGVGSSNLSESTKVRQQSRLQCYPVTVEVMGSNPIRTAKIAIQ